MAHPLVGIIMGSDSDLPTMAEAAQMLEYFEIPYAITVLSAHRTPKRLETYAEYALVNGIKVIIAGAGGAAHLPGMMAAYTPLPVIGVPVKSAAMSGIDSLYSVVQMPKGVPVAAVAIGNAANAGILAAQIIGTADSNVLKRVADYKKELENSVNEKARTLETEGYARYLKRL